MVMTVTQHIKTQFHKIYHYLFTYDTQKRTTTGQASLKMAGLLSYALLNRSFVLLTFDDGTSEIGQVIRRLSAESFVFRSYNQKVLTITDINKVFRVDLG